MYRATTPTHKFCFREVNPDDFKTILITYAQNDRIVLEKGKDDLTITSEDVEGETHYHASLKLTQEETKLFSLQSGKTGSVYIQVRACDYDGNVVASNMIKVSLLDVLNDEVLE